MFRSARKPFVRRSHRLRRRARRFVQESDARDMLAAEWTGNVVVGVCVEALEACGTDTPVAAWAEAQVRCTVHAHDALLLNRVEEARRHVAALAQRAFLAGTSPR